MVNVFRNDWRDMIEDKFIELLKKYKVYSSYKRQLKKRAGRITLHKALTNRQPKHYVAWYKNTMENMFRTSNMSVPATYMRMLKLETEWNLFLEMLGET